MNGYLFVPCRVLLSQFVGLIANKKYQDILAVKNVNRNKWRWSQKSSWLPMCYISVWCSISTLDSIRPPQHTWNTSGNFSLSSVFAKLFFSRFGSVKSTQSFLPAPSKQNYFHWQFSSFRQLHIAVSVCLISSFWRLLSHNQPCPVIATRIAKMPAIPARRPRISRPVRRIQRVRLATAATMQDAATSSRRAPCPSCPSRTSCAPQRRWTRTPYTDDRSMLTVATTLGPDP